MGLKKVKTSIKKDEEGDVGIGTLIIFIAMVLVAAIAASLILYAAALLQQQGQRTVDDAVSEVSGGLTVVNVAGDRNPDGADSSIASGYMPSRDDQPPTGGILWNVTESRDGVSPLGIVLNWSSAIDYGSGLAEEIIYRTSVYDPTNPAVFNEQIARNRLLTLNQLNPSYEMTRLTTGFGSDRQYTDYTARDDNSTSYAYAIVGVDSAGNRVIYTPIDSSASTDDASHDEDQTVPVGGSMTSTSRPDDYSVMLFWVPATDAGSGVGQQLLYRSSVSVGSLANVMVDGRRIISVPIGAELITTLNSTASSYADAPSDEGTYTYYVIVEDWAGNQVSLGTLSYIAENVDSIVPSAVQAFCARQYIQSVEMTWSEASDDETFIGEYLIYRSTSMSALDSVEELRNSTPIASVDSNTIHYYDYSGVSGTLYYYTVVAVDAADNYAQPVIPSNTIQMIEIKVKTVPGSMPILFTSLMIEITDGEKDVTLGFNSAEFGPAGATADSFSVQILRDLDGVFASTFSLSDGGLVKIFVDAGEIGLNLHAESAFSMKFIPSIGQPTIEDCSIPYLGTYRYVNLI
ncbi:MAG: hypothetical protein IH630_05005 [Thermoplasmata archaeon]|nr:hypothetical protein [Thermoplasmata archaeon]